MTTTWTHADCIADAEQTVEEMGLLDPSEPYTAEQLRERAQQYLAETGEPCPCGRFDPDIPATYTPDEFNVTAAAKVARETGQWSGFMALTGLDRDRAQAYASDLTDGRPAVRATPIPF